MENKNDFSTVVLKITKEYKKELRDIVRYHPKYKHLTMSSFIRMCINLKMEEIKNEDNK